MEGYNCGLEIASDAARCPRCGQRFKPRTDNLPDAGKPTLLDRLKAKLGKKDEGDPPSSQP